MFMDFKDNANLSARMLFSGMNVRKHLVMKGCFSLEE